MALPNTEHANDVAAQALEAFDKLNGSQPGFRPAHAKGILLAGTFTPSPDAASLTRAPHIQRDTQRGSNASPRGIAIRFNLAEHVHTDIIAHSVNGFPVRTAEEFVEFLRAIGASGASVTKPTPVESFLSTHPAALKFVQAPKPMPASFAKESFFAVNAYRFTNAEGVSRYGRYRIQPDGSNEFLDPAAEAKAAPNFLFDEIKERLMKGAVKMRIVVQVAADGDIVDDSTVDWPTDRTDVGFGTIELTSVMPDNDTAQRHIIFDPIPRVDGIEPSADPLLEPRATIYLISGRRRRAGGPK
jgi:catalase